MCISEREHDLVLRLIAHLLQKRENHALPRRSAWRKSFAHTQVLELDSWEARQVGSQPDVEVIEISLMFCLLGLVLVDAHRTSGVRDDLFRRLWRCCR